MRKILVLSVFSLMIVSSLFASFAGSDNEDVSMTRQGMYTYFRSDRLLDEEFEFYHSIDACSDFEEYVVIRYPESVKSPSLGTLYISSTNGDYALKLYGAITKGEFIMTVPGSESEIIAAVLEGDDIRVSVSDKNGNLIPLNSDIEGLKAITKSYRGRY